MTSSSRFDKDLFPERSFPMLRRRMIASLVVAIVSIWAVQRVIADKPTAAAAKAEIKKEWLEGNPDQRKELDPLQGQPAPALETTVWVNGEPMKLADLKGKVVMLDFWATWC